MEPWSHAAAGCRWSRRGWRGWRWWWRRRWCGSGGNLSRDAHGRFRNPDQDAHHTRRSVDGRAVESKHKVKGQSPKRTSLGLWPLSFLSRVFGLWSFVFGLRLLLDRYVPLQPRHFLLIHILPDLTPELLDVRIRPILLELA